MGIITGTHENEAHPEWIGSNLLRVWKDSGKKSCDGVEHRVPVPETDTGRQVENTKGSEITLSKELGKMTP